MAKDRAENTDENHADCADRRNTANAVAIMAIGVVTDFAK
jgi:hypothetical protein